MKSLIICFLIPALCLAQTCMFINGTATSQSCLSPNGYGGCSLCASGYGLYGALCYPPCPSGWTELMPGYCVNSTLIQNHKNFTLCPTNETMEMTGKAGMFLCSTQNTGGCQCAPACPSGYSSIGCECVYGNTLAEVDHSHSWLYAFSAIGLFAILLAAGYLVKKYLISNEVKIPLQSQAAINSRYANIVEAQ